MLAATQTIQLKMAENLVNNDMQWTWRQAITVQFQTLIENFLEGWGNKNSKDVQVKILTVNLQNTSLTMKLGFIL